MTEKDNGKGNLLITYLFTDDDNTQLGFRKRYEK